MTGLIMTLILISLGAGFIYELFKFVGECNEENQEN
jgi:hypothetical protein